MNKGNSLQEVIKRLGYAHNSHVKLYGESFRLVSDPIVENDRVVFVDGMEIKTRSIKRLRIPLPVVIMARQSLRS